MTSEMTLEVFAIALSAIAFIRILDSLCELIGRKLLDLKLKRLRRKGKSVADPCQHCGCYDPELGCMTPYFAREAGCNPDLWDKESREGSDD